MLRAGTELCVRIIAYDSHRLDPLFIDPWEPRFPSCVFPNLATARAANESQLPPLTAAAGMFRKDILELLLERVCIFSYIPINSKHLFNRELTQDE